MELINYLLKVSACSVLFFAFYLLVLRKLTFFKINRFYLLASLLLSFLIPSLQITVEREVAQTVSASQPIAPQIADLSEPKWQTPIITGAEQIADETFDWLILLPYLYGSVVAVLLLLAAWRIFQLLKHTKSSVKEVNGLKLVVKDSGFTNCSFFNYVFINENNLKEEELKVLLTHEEVHAKAYHSADKMLMTLFKAVLWFNPVIYLYDKALEQAHEYEADEATSQNFGAEVYAALLLRLAVSKNSNPLIHNFVKSPIKQRIKMLFNAKSKNMKKLIYLLALPIGLGLIWGFTIKILPLYPQENEFTLVIDAGHGGKQKGAVVNGVAEKQIALSLSKKIKALAEEKGIKVIETRTNDSDVSLQDRANAQGSFLLSLHVNSEPKGNTQNGIQMFTAALADTLNMMRSAGMTFNLFHSLRNISGITVSNKPIEKRLYLLESSKMPGVMLEVGFLTNKKDFQFLTNEEKQHELAKAIVEGVINYKKFNKTDGQMKAMIKDTKLHAAKYTAWKKSDKYKALVAKAAKIKAELIQGKIESLHYFSVKHIMDGFILNANGERYRVYLTKAQIEQTKFKVGDPITVKVKNGEVWFDSDYPVLKPTEILASNFIRTKGRMSVKVSNFSPKEKHKDFEYSAQDSSVTEKGKGIVHLYGKARLKNNKGEILADEIHYNVKTRELIAVKSRTNGTN